MTGPHMMRTLIGLFVLTITVQAQVKDRDEIQLQAAIKLEMVDGDMKGAIEQFKKLAESSKPHVAAEALVHLAACYDRLGAADAKATYERVVREYPNQKQAVARARAWLDAHVKAGAVAGIRDEQVWSGKAVDLEGRVTHDGRYFVYPDWSAGMANLAIRDLKSGATRVLTRGATTEAFAENPVPSPDGTLIAFRWGERQADASIRLVRADGSNMRTLLLDRHENYLQGWSPDGKYLASTRSLADNTHQIVLISTADGSVSQLKSMSWRAPVIGGFSPDGRYLVYAVNKDANAGDGGVFVLAIGSNRETPLVQGAADFSDVTWSPDGSRVLFTSDRSETNALWSIRIADGRPAGAPELLRSNIGTLSIKGIASDGSLYYGRREVQVEAYLADLDLATLAVRAPVLVTNQAVGRNQSPELSPDGTRIAFVRRLESGAVVVIRSMATGEERTVTTLSPVYGARTVQWFPDGRSLLVNDRNGNQKKRLRQVDLESAQAKTVFEGPWTMWTTALSADGRWLFYSVKELGPGDRGTLRLVKRSLETGEEKELYTTQSPGTGLFGLSASPDGTRVAFSVNVDYTQRAVMIVSSSGGVAREVRRWAYFNAPLPQGSLSWTPDGRYLIVSAGRGPMDEQQLAALPIDGGEMRLLGLRMPTISTRAVSADGRRLAFTGSTSKQELWVIRNLLANSAAAR